MTVGNFIRFTELMGLTSDSLLDMSAGHDEIMIGGHAPETLKPEVVKELDDLGWRWEEYFECWAHFT